jgi:formylglycine-generating enzyme required for sulfatase activity/dienelactone hydrolase
MGIVFKAEDTKLDRTVALKVLPAGALASDDDRERFLREARAAAKLHHSNIATIFEIGDALADGASTSQPYIAMEYVAGSTLAGLIAEGPLEQEQVRAIGRQMCEALTLAHGAGVIHRDIKPGNVMLTEAGVVKVLDFGLAKIGDDPAITKDGSTIGTIAYMSPEQARGEAVDARSDLWSLGVILYEMLTGTRPFAGSYDTAVLYSLLNETQPPLPEAVPSDLRDLVGDLLSKDPDERPSSADEILVRLGGMVDDSGTPAIAQRRSPLIGSALVAVVLIAGAAVGFGLMRNSTKADVRSKLLPRLDSLLAASTYDTRSVDTWEAFDLARRAVETLPDEPYVQELAGRAMGQLWVDADQPIDVSVRSDSAGRATWLPLAGASAQTVPRGYHQIRIRSAGFVEQDRLVFLSDSTRLVVTLDASGTVPEGMVRVDESERPLRMPYLDHLPARQVSSFLMDRFEVTNSQFKVFIDEGGYADRALWHPSSPDPAHTFVDATGRPGPSTWSLGRFPKGQEDYPVRGLSWYEADAFARWMRRALPTVYHFNAAASFFAAAYLLPGANIDNQGGPLRVGASGSMSGPGTYDLAGNVREWTANGSVRDGRRFTLGGAWNDPPYSFQDAYTLDPLDRGETNGFRTIQWFGDDVASLNDPIELPFRDFATEQPVDDATFAQFQGYFGYDPAPLNPILISVDSSDADFVVERVSYHAGYGTDRMTAWVFVPAAATPPYQAILYFPGDWAFGVDRPIPNLPPAGDYWDYIVRDGRLLVVPVFRNQFDRGSELASSTPAESIVYRDHMIMWSKEVGRTVDYLLERGDVDPEALAFVGLSWGSRVSPVMLYHEPRFRTAVLEIGGLRFQRSRPEVEPFNYLPRIELPVLMLNGRYDFYFPLETSQIPFFENLGTPRADKQMRLYETSHSLPKNELIRETLAWFDRYLGPVER